MKPDFESSCSTESKGCLKNIIPLSVAVLAGGKSSRMGTDKTKLLYDGVSFLSRIITELSYFDEIILSVANREGEGGKADSEEETGDSSGIKNESLPGEIRSKIKIVRDRQSDSGPIEGILRALEESSNEYVFFCAADMPLIKKEVPLFLSKFICSDFDAYVLTCEGRFQPLCAVYSKKMIPVIRSQIEKNEFKLSFLFEKVRTKFIPVEISSVPKTALCNINTPEEYRKLCAPYVFCVSGLKNSGKTRMVLLLIEEFIKRGFTVGVIKHDGHDCFTDAEGTDTARFTEEGALCTAIFSDSRFSFTASEKTDENELIGKIRSLENKPDIIIIEGLKDSLFPKVEVLRKCISEKSVCKKETLICTVTDFPVVPYRDVKNYFSGDVKEIADEILRKIAR